MVFWFSWKRWICLQWRLPTQSIRRYTILGFMSPRLPGAYTHWQLTRDMVCWIFGLPWSSLAVWPHLFNITLCDKIGSLGESGRRLKARFLAPTCWMQVRKPSCSCCTSIAYRGMLRRNQLLTSFVPLSTICFSQSGNFLIELVLFFKLHGSSPMIEHSYCTVHTVQYMTGRECPRRSKTS